MTYSSSHLKVSFVNGICTTKGGTHVDLIVNQIVSKIGEVVKKQTKQSAAKIKPQHIKSQLWVFINCNIENPTFDSQTKDTMTLKSSKFGSSCALSPEFLKKGGQFFNVRIHHLD